VRAPGRDDREPCLRTPWGGVDERERGLHGMHCRTDRHRAHPPKGQPYRDTTVGPVVARR
jgi:hypothetical protein